MKAIKNIVAVFALIAVAMLSGNQAAYASETVIGFDVQRALQERPVEQTNRVEINEDTVEIVVKQEKPAEAVEADKFAETRGFDLKLAESLYGERF